MSARSSPLGFDAERTSWLVSCWPTVKQECTVLLFLQPQYEFRLLPKSSVEEEPAAHLGNLHSAERHQELPCDVRSVDEDLPRAAVRMGQSGEEPLPVRQQSSEPLPTDAHPAHLGTSTPKTPLE